MQKLVIKRMRLPVLSKIRFSLFFIMMFFVCPIVGMEETKQNYFDRLPNDVIKEIIITLIAISPDDDYEEMRDNLKVFACSERRMSQLIRDEKIQKLLKEVQLKKIVWTTDFLKNRFEDKVKEQSNYIGELMPFECDTPITVIPHLKDGSEKDAELVPSGAPLARTAYFDAVKFAKLLIARGAPIDAKKDRDWDPDCFEMTALNVAARYGSMKVARLLLEHKADVNAQCADNRTPLMQAASNGRPAMLLLLLSHGAHPNARDEKGKSVLQYACDETMKQLLKQHGAIESRSDDLKYKVLAFLNRNKK